MPTSKTRRTDTLLYILVMAVFGCLGPLVRAITLPTVVITCLRAWLSSLALFAYLMLSSHRPSLSDVKEVLGPMTLSGVLMCGDWLGLFIAYRYTTIAAATVCFYLCPVLVLIASALLLHERFTLKHLLCVLAAFAGVVLISGIVGGGSFGLKGLMFALIGAVSYAGIVLTNKRWPKGNPVLKCFIQLAVAAVCMTPAALFTADPAEMLFTPKCVLLLLLLGVFFTAGTYIIYFGTIVKLPARRVAIFAYADPVMAVIVSVLFLSEPFTLQAALGSALVIGAAAVSELSPKSKRE